MPESGLYVGLMYLESLVIQQNCRLSFQECKKSQNDGKNYGPGGEGFFENCIGC